MVAEKIGIPFEARYVVSIYFTEVSIIPDPKKTEKGSNSPFLN